MLEIKQLTRLQIIRYCEKLEEENKKLKSEIRRITRQRDNLKGISDNLVDENRYLEEENRKLKERIKELELCNLNLQTWIDNKEKVNKSLREELEFYKKQYEHTMGEDEKKEIEDLVDRNIDVAKRLADK